MIRAIACLLCTLPLCSHSALAGEAGELTELLAWQPGAEEPPRPTVLVERFKNNDLGIIGPDFFGQHAAFGSVVQYFCGDDAALRKEFAGTFAKYLVANHDGHYPGYVQPEQANCTLYTYRTPYEYSQTGVPTVARQAYGQTRHLRAGRPPVQ